MRGKDWVKDGGSDERTAQLPASGTADRGVPAEAGTTPRAWPPSARPLTGRILRRRLLAASGGRLCWGGQLRFIKSGRKGSPWFRGYHNATRTRDNRACAVPPPGTSTNSSLLAKKSSFVPAAEGWKGNTPLCNEASR